MKKTLLLIACMSFALSVQAADRTVGDVKYSIASEKKCGVGRFDLVYRVKVSRPAIPTEKQVRSVVDDIFAKTRTSLYWKGSLTTFIYIDDMPLDSAAYAAAEGHNKVVESFWISKQNYETWKFIKSQQE